MNGVRNRAAASFAVAPVGPRWKLALASVGLLAVLLHGLNLVYLAKSFDCNLWSLECSGEVSPWAANDTSSYLRVADRIREQGFFGVSYLRRLPGYPALLALSLTLTETAAIALWLGPLLAGAAAVAISWIVWLVTGRQVVSLVAGFLFCCWPNAYQFSGLLLTDGIHAFLVVTALASTLWWRNGERTVAALLSVASWMAAQTLRLTFFPLPIIFPMLLWKRRSSRRYVLFSSAMWVALLLIPTFVIGSNWLRHGLSTPSAVPARNLACYSVPRLKDEMGMGEFFHLRRECIRRYEELGVEERVRLQLAEAGSFLLQYPAASLRSFSAEILRQLLSPLSPYYGKDQAVLYPGFMSAGQLLVAIFWLCGVGGWFVTMRRQPHLAWFLLFTLLIVLLPAATSHLVGARLKFPLELLFLPMAVVFMDHLVRLLVRFRVNWSHEGKSLAGGKDDHGGLFA